MVDPRDKHTATLPGIKEPVKLGRKPIFSEAMTPAQRKARQRREQDQRILETDAKDWSISDCLRILNTKKFDAFHEFAWERLGQIKGYA